MYEFDDSRHPLIILRMRGTVSDDELASFRADVDAIVDRAEPFAVVFDIVDIPIPPRATTMELLAWCRTMRARYIVLYDEAVPRIPSFAAYHMPSMLGNVLRFFLQMLPSTKSQHMVCTSFDQAILECERALERMVFDDELRHVAGR